MEKIKEGIAEKMAIFAHLLGSFVICIVFPLWYGWKLTAVILSCTPFIVITTAIAEKVGGFIGVNRISLIVIFSLPGRWKTL